ncbi:MAG: transglycosylase SLT domain-containing protein [Sphingorhabdus sp.]
MPTSPFIDAGAPAARRVDQAIATASRRTGVDFDYLMNQARIESAMNPTAKASTSSAVGLYQFTKQTWLATLKTHGAEHQLGWAADAISQSADGSFRVDDPRMRDAILDLRTDPEASSVMAGEFAADNSAHLTTSLGRSPEPVDLYLAHFLGANGAVQFLSAHDANPDALAAPLLPKAAAANRAIFYDKQGAPRSVGEIRQLFEAKLTASGTSANWAQAMPAGGAQSVSSQSWRSQAARTPQTTAMPEMRGFEPMPKNLSLSFAHQAYQRLASLGGGARS